MLHKQRWRVALLLCMLAFSPTMMLSEEHVLLYEEFDDLENWKPFIFPNIKEYSTYTIMEEGVLKLESHASASALEYKERFNVYEYPLLEWRWKAENVYEKGDATKKTGDDYPLRIYVIFEYDSQKASLAKRLKYNAARVFYGEYPPHSSLNYIWANKEHEQRIITSTYAEESQMILVQQGKEHLHTWQVEQVTLLEDYRLAFGEDPPEETGILIMNDSDATKEQSISYFDYLKIYRETETDK